MSDQFCYLKKRKFSCVGHFGIALVPSQNALLGALPPVMQEAALKMQFVTLHARALRGLAPGLMHEPTNLTLFLYHLFTSSCLSQGCIIGK